MTDLPQSRQQYIETALQNSGSVVISLLAKELNVSEMTIRRDLKLMEDAGILSRVHGGAVAPKPISYGERLNRNAIGKAKAVAKLESLIPDTGTLYLDGSTTMMGLIPRLARCRDLQVATNNVDTFELLSECRHLHPLLIGGRLDRRTDNLVGGLARRSVLAIAFDAAFFSCYGITPDHGPMEATLEDAEIKELVASRSQAVHIALDHGKLGRVVPGAWNPGQEKTVLATDLAPTDELLAPYRGLFARIL
jgi:DeoR/GlpR family transcriptional regulator of sugar metabolism